MLAATFRHDGSRLAADPVRRATAGFALFESGLDLASALYRVRFTSEGLLLQVLRDECRGRREAMPLRPFRRVD